MPETPTEVMERARVDLMPADQPFHCVGQPLPVGAGLADSSVTVMVMLVLHIVSGHLKSSLEQRQSKPLVG